MAKDDPEELRRRKARAERLQREIDGPADDPAQGGPAPESPREFIHRRMRELDTDKDPPAD